MLYLTGSFPAKEASVQALANAGVGFMATPYDGQFNKAIRDLPVWAADNRCFSDSERFVLERFLAWLERCESVAERCLFATAPDVVGNAVATLERSMPVLPLIRSVGYRAAFVAQDGLEEVPWEAFDCLFIGGADGFKLSAKTPKLVREAKKHGKWVHMGRVNSARRYLWAREIGCDSADGTHLAFAPDLSLPKVLSWVTSARQLTLENIA